MIESSIASFNILFLRFSESYSIVCKTYTTTLWLEKKKIDRRKIKLQPLYSATSCDVTHFWNEMEQLLEFHLVPAETCKVLKFSSSITPL